MPSNILDSFSKRNPKLAPFVEKLRGHLSWLKEHDVGEVLPRVAAVDIGLSEADTVALLGLFEKAGLVKRRYDLVCEATREVVGSYESLEEIPDQVDCKICGREHGADDLRIELVFPITRGRTANAAA
jgi:hypothetical protein